MKTRENSPGYWVVGRMLLATTLLLLCLIGLLSYALLGRGQTIQTRKVSSKSAELEQLIADVRTVAAAISYLLEPETASPVPTSPNSPNFTNSQIILGQASVRSSSVSNEWSGSMTNLPSPG